VTTRWFFGGGSAGGNFGHRGNGSDGLAVFRIGKLKGVVGANLGVLSSLPPHFVTLFLLIFCSNHDATAPYLLVLHVSFIPYVLTVVVVVPPFKNIIISMLTYFNIIWIFTQAFALYAPHNKCL